MAPLFLVIVFESTSGASKAAMKSSSGTSKYFQVLPRQGYEKYSWYLRSNMKLVVERGSRHLGHNGCQEAEVYSEGTHSHHHHCHQGQIQILIHIRIEI